MQRILSSRVVRLAVRVALALLVGAVPLIGALHPAGAAPRAASSTALPAGIEPAAARYLTAVLDAMQRNSVRSGQIRWTALRRHALALARHAHTTADTYPAIRWAVAQLGDRHSIFLTPAQVRSSQQGGVVSYGFLPAGDVVAQVFPGSPAARAGMRPGDRLVLVDGVPFARYGGHTGATLRLTVRRAGLPHPFIVRLTAAPFSIELPPGGKRLPGAIGYLELPGLLDGPMVPRYAPLAQRAIRRIDHAPTCGWVVDLRRDVGGDMWPMLAGVGPILGPGVAGRFVSSSAVQAWRYADGQAQLDGAAMAQVAAPYTLSRSPAPVAVLTSRLTNSAGEAIAVAFRGRPGTRSFGEPTAGVPTANAGVPLADGAMLYLTVAVDADRTGRRYDGRIAPDQPVGADWSVFATGRDPVLRTALRWLASRPACAA